MLPEGVVGPALRRRPEGVSPPGVGGEGGPVPLLDGVGRICQDHVEPLQAVAFHESGRREGVAAHDLELLDAVEEAVHPGDGGGHQVPFLAVQANIAPLQPPGTEVGDGGEEHPPGAAGRIVDRLARLRLQHLGHEVDDGAVGVELGRGMAGVVGELLDQVLVAVPEFVLGQIGDGEFERGEVLDEVTEHSVGEPVFVRPLRVAEDAVERIRIRRLDTPHCFLQSLADVCRHRAEIVPVALMRDLEPIVLREPGIFFIAPGFRESCPVLLIVDVGDPFEEEQREDVGLEVGRVDRPTQNIGGLPEM